MNIILNVSERYHCVVVKRLQNVPYIQQPCCRFLRNSKLTGYSRLEVYFWAPLYQWRIACKIQIVFYWNNLCQSAVNIYVRYNCQSTWWYSGGTLISVVRCVHTFCMNNHKIIQMGFGVWLSPLFSIVSFRQSSRPQYCIVRFYLISSTMT